MMKLSIIIKSYNEAKNIGKCIESILYAVRDIEYEVILADSASTDNTVEIAMQYPVKVVSLKNPNERSCGIGAQLGFQYARGDYIFIVDADMELQSGFIEDALGVLEASPDIAGVVGSIEERGGDSYEFRTRKKQGYNKNTDIKWLDGGGVYRREAIQDVGYLTNMNLHACEEKELGMRLRQNGWRFKRINVLSVTHSGHKEGTFKLLRTRWNSKYTDGIGELIRHSIGKSYLLDVLCEYKQYMVFTFLVVCIFLGMLFSFYSIFPMIIALSGLALFFGILLIRKRSVIDSALSMIHFFVYSIAIMRGVVRRQRDPHGWINSAIIKE